MQLKQITSNFIVEATWYHFTFKISLQMLDSIIYRYIYIYSITTFEVSVRNHLATWHADWDPQVGPQGILSEDQISMAIG